MLGFLQNQHAKPNEQQINPKKNLPNKTQGAPSNVLAGWQSEAYAGPDIGLQERQRADSVLSAVIYEPRNRSDSAASAASYHSVDSVGAGNGSSIIYATPLADDAVGGSGSGGSVNHGAPLVPTDTYGNNGRTTLVPEDAYGDADQRQQQQQQPATYSIPEIAGAKQRSQAPGTCPGKRTPTRHAGGRADNGGTSSRTGSRGGGGQPGARQSLSVPRSASATITRARQGSGTYGFSAEDV